MSFVDQLETLISKATKDYSTTSKTEPVIKSIEDGTERGKELDALLKKQQAEKKKLWTKLYKLEKLRMQNGRNKVFLEKPTNPFEKKLLTAMHESYELEKEIEKNSSPNLLIVDEKVLEIQFKEQIDRELKEYEQSIEFLKTDIEKARQQCAEEKVVLSECKELNIYLNERMKALKEADPETIASKMEEQYALVQSMLKQDTQDMIHFIDEHYPPHAVDEDDPIGNECDMKNILQHLMNQSYTEPAYPYVSLEPGTYWKPYIETLAKAGIIQYHPEDTNQICLEDFKL